MLVAMRLAVFLLFALLVGFVGRFTRRVRMHRVKRWRIATSSHASMMVGTCTTLPEVHTSYLSLDAPCPFCTTVQRAAYRRVQLGPAVLDWYATPPASEAVPPDDDDEPSSGPFLIGK